MPPEREETAAALTAGIISSRAGTTITTALDKVRHIPDPALIAEMEHNLTQTAIDNDHDFLTRIAHRWIDALDQDGTEPSEENLRHLAAGTLPTTGGLRPQVMVTVGYRDLLNSIQTTANRGPRYAPKRNHTTNQPTDTDGWPPNGPQLLPGTWQTSDPDPGTAPDTWPTAEPQFLTGTRPSTNITSINCSGTDLFATPLPGGPTGATTGSGTFTYTGPVTASTIRKIACDADIIPILLGSQGRILDIGRTTRVFPPHIRKALNARDQGCAFPNCTIPAPWCEAHHITYWSQGGPTSTDNGVLLCTHHHLIHKEQWNIHIKNGIPWFIPPPHIDPRQQPQQNHHHKT